MVGVLGGFQQGVDEGVALFPGRAFVGDEGPRFFRRRRQSGEIEVDAPDKFLVAAEFAGGDLHALPLFRDELVDLAPGLGFGPGESLAIPHHGEGGGGVGAFVAGEDGGLAAAGGAEESEVIVGGDVRVARFDEGFQSDVAGFPVGVTRHDAELLATADILHDGIFRKKFDGGDAGGAEIEIRPTGDPAADDVVVAGAVVGQGTGLVRDRAARFQEHEGVVG